MKIYKNNNVHDDNRVFVAQNADAKIPRGYDQIDIFYHVQEVTPEEDDTDESLDEKSDYHIKSGNKYIYYKFTSEQGRKAFADNSFATKRTPDLNAVTCPSCLIAAGQEDRVVYLDGKKATAKTPSKSKTESQPIEDATPKKS